MILFEVKSDGTVRSTPSRVPQGSSLADLVVVTEADYALVTMHLVPPSFEIIEDIQFTPTKTAGNRLWQANLPPSASITNGRLHYQIFLHFADGRVIPTAANSIEILAGVISNMPETAEDLSDYSIQGVYRLLSSIYSVTEQNSEKLETIDKRLDDLDEVRLYTLTIPASEWTDNTPTTAVTAIEGVEDENDSSFTALLLPVNNETRVASRDTSIYVENVDVRGNGKITVTMKREGEPPATDLKYVVIAFTEPNETGKAFPVSVGFIGIGGSGAGDGGETGGITEQELSKAIYDHNVSDASHEDIRLFLSRLEERLETLADSDDTTLDQLSEIVAYIKANKALIDSVTTAKVNVVDIIDNLSTNVSNKPLSAAQGVKLNQSVVKLTTDYDGLKKSVDDLLYVPISIDEFKSSVTSAEKGSTVTETTLSWVLNKAPEAVSIDGVSVEPLESADYTLRDLAIAANKKFTLSATDERGKTVTKDAAINFYNGVYYGVSEAPAAYDSQFIIALGESGKKVLRGSKLTSFTVTAGEGEYIYYCLPVSMGACSFKVGGFDGGFDLVATLDGDNKYENEHGHPEAYRIYRSTNAGLGATTVEVK